MIRFVFLLLISFSVNAEFSNNYRMINNDTGVSYGKLNLSTEYDIYNGTQYITPTISYTSPTEWDIGVTTQNVLVSGFGGAQNFENDVYFNISKKHRWNKQISTTIATQTGISSTNYNGVHLLDYIDTRFKPYDWLLLHGGIYYVNSNLSTTVNYVGYMTGIGFKLIPGTLHWTADYFSNHSNVSGSVTQLTYYANKNLDLYLGAGIPEKQSGNSFYGIVGFNWNMKL